MMDDSAARTPGPGFTVTRFRWEGDAVEPFGYLAPVLLRTVFYSIRGCDP